MDANNCIISTAQLVTEPSLVVISPVISNVACTGGTNGSISLNVSGGVSPYHYQWSNSYKSQSISNLSSGIYSVTVMDYNGCSTARSYTITQPANPLTVNGLITSASSGSATDGSINITINGGTAPYSFNWSTGSTSEDVSGLGAGSYTVAITDMNGCTTSSSYSVGVSTGVENIQISSSEVKVYPNPANEFTVIEALGHKIDKIELLNLLGQKIFTNQVNDSITKINTTPLLSGTYFIKIYFNNNTVTKKINVSK
jgi:hypothetical protein